MPNPFAHHFNLQVRGPQVFFDLDEPAPVAEPAAAPAAPGPDPAPTSAPPGAGGIFGDPELNSIFEFDPFEGNSSQSAPADTTPAPTGGDSLAAPTGADSLTSPQPASQPSGMDDVVESLRAVADSLKGKGNDTTPATEPADPIETLFSDVQLPPALLSAVRSESPEESAMALNLIVQGTARMAVREARGLLDSFVTEALPKILGSYTQAQTQAKTVHDDFYGTYKELDKPEIKPLITNLAQQMALEQGDKFKGWNPEFRDAVARRFMELLKVAAPAAPSAPAPVAPFTPQSGARPAPAGENSIMDFF